MELSRLEAFRAVAKEKNFTKAAARIFRTQPAVSQAVAALEDDLAEKLFIRRGRQVRLTQAGEILLGHVEEAFHLLDQGRRQVAALKGLEAGALTICASDTTCCYVLPEVLGRFRREHPAVEVRLINRPSPEAAGLVAGYEADLGIVTLPLEHAGLKTRRLILREDVAVCEPEHPLARRRRIRFEDLLPYPLLLLDRGSNTRAYIDQRLAQAGREARIIMETGSIEVIKRLVRLGFGVSLVPRVSVQEEVIAGHLAAIRVFRRDECRHLGLITPHRTVPSPAAEAFTAMLDEFAAREKRL